MDSPVMDGRDSSPAALYFSTNVAAAESRQPSIENDGEFQEAVKSRRLSLDASLAMCAAGLTISQRNGSGRCLRHDQPAISHRTAGEHNTKAASDAASVSTVRAGETPFEMAALSSPFSSGGSTASSNSMTPALSEPQSSSEDRCSMEQSSAAAQSAVLPAGAASAIKSPFEVVAETASPFGSIVPVPEDSLPAPAAASSGPEESGCACRGPDGAVGSLTHELSSGRPSAHTSRDSQQEQIPREHSPSTSSGTPAEHGRRPPSAVSSTECSSHAEGGYLSREELSARLSMLKKAHFTRLLSRSIATAPDGADRLNSDSDDAGIDNDGNAPSLASQLGDSRHHEEAAVMAAHRRRSVERRSSDLPRVLEAISEGGSKEACQSLPSDSTRIARSQLRP